MSAVAFFQRLEKCPRQSSNVWNSSRNAVSSRRLWRRDSLISTPAAFQVPFSPGCVRFRAVMLSPTSAHRRPFTPPVESRHFKHGPRSRRAIRHECAPTVQTSRPFALPAGRPAGRSSRSRARHRSGWRALAVAGVPRTCGVRGPASSGSLRAHPSRHGATPCHAGCCALRSRDAVETCPQAPGRKWGACEHVSFSIWAGPDRFPLACVDTLCYGVTRLQPMCRAIPAQNDELK